ncbi:MAG: response regulator transcription factor [Desulfobulbaceae bacterium]|nr:response regulator transcription factor [Desulfobulbaceae bacterium]
MINVFLADDHGAVRDGMSALMEVEQDIHVVGTAGDGRQAVEQIKKIRPDIVVMDIAMPELNGIDATRQIGKTCPTVKVIMLSMHDSSEHIYQALKAGAKGYLLKESAGKEVVTAIREVSAGNRYLSGRIEEIVFEDYLSHRDAAPKKSPIDKLSDRERQVLQLVVEGKSSTEISEILFLSSKTVDTYRSRLMHKLAINDLPGLVKFALRHGLTTM